MRVLQNFELNNISGGMVTFLAQGKELEVFMTDKSDVFKINNAFGINDCLTLNSDGSVNHSYAGFYSWFTNYKTDTYSISWLKTTGGLSHYKITIL